MPVLHLLISGKVQGVYFRASAKKIADQLGVRGWTRNTEEGKVEIVAAADSTALERFTAWCHQGPAAAEVDYVQITAIASLEEFTSFSIRR
jgi:acylphosphatase